MQRKTTNVGVSRARTTQRRKATRQATQRELEETGSIYFILLFFHFLLVRLPRHPVGNMDVIKAVSTYLTRLLSPAQSGGAGMKVLLVDQDTTPILSIALTQSTLLAHEVYLTDRIDNAQRQRMRHLKAIVLLRPTDQSIAALCSELAWPKYASYHVYFTNVLSKSHIERIAEADEHDVVKEIQVSRLLAALSDPVHSHV